jgi:TrpR-related protein YerC/YecD
MNKFKFNKLTDNLFTAILKLDSLKEAERFFRDLCTAEELKEMADRFEIARLVAQELPYREIAKKLKTSTTTVGRVAAWLNNGEGGYRLALAKMAAHHNSPKNSRKS